MKNKNEWFKEWFNSPYYHILYQNRNLKEADLFIKNLSDFLQIKQNANVLDLACGNGRHSIILNKLGFKCNESHFENGLKNIQENTGYKARLEILKKSPTIIFDGGHNAQGIEQSLLYIKQKHKGCIHLIYGSSKDKNHKAIFKALPKDSTMCLSPFKGERSLRKEDLIQLKNNYQKNAIVCKDVNEAILKCSEKSNKGDCIFIFGSFFLYEEILK